MILIYGPAGAGKSTQGQLLAQKLGRKWLSAGEIIRNSGKFKDFTSKGAMIDEQTLVGLIFDAVSAVRAEGKEVVFDGQPGSPEQFGLWEKVGLAEMVELVVVLEVSQKESIRRLSQRGRDDDEMAVWMEKFRYYEQKIYSFLTPVKAAKIPVVYVDGEGDVEEVNKRIVQRLDRHLIGELES